MRVRIPGVRSGSGLARTTAADPRATATPAEIPARIAPLPSPISGRKTTTPTNTPARMPLMTLFMRDASACATSGRPNVLLLGRLGAEVGQHVRWDGLVRDRRRPDERRDDRHGEQRADHAERN